MTSSITPLPFHEDKDKNLWILGDKLFFALKPPSEAQRNSIKDRLGKDCIEVQCTIVSKCVVATADGKSEAVRHQAIKCYPDADPLRKYEEADVSIQSFIHDYCVQTPPYNDALPKAVVTLFVRRSELEALPSASSETDVMDAVKARLKNKDGFWVVQTEHGGKPKFVAVAVAH